MMIFDLIICLDRVSGGLGAFRHLLLKVGILKVIEFFKFDLK